MLACAGAHRSCLSVGPAARQRWEHEADGAHSVGAAGPQLGGSSRALDITACGWPRAAGCHAGAGITAPAVTSNVSLQVCLFWACSVSVCYIELGSCCKKHQLDVGADLKGFCGGLYDAHRPLNDLQHSFVPLTI